MYQRSDVILRVTWAGMNMTYQWSVNCSNTSTTELNEPTNEVNPANKQQKLVIPALKESPTPCRCAGQRTESMSIPYTLCCLHYSPLIILNEIYSWAETCSKTLKLYGRNNTWNRDSTVSVVYRLRAGRSRVRFPSPWKINVTLRTSQTSSGGPPILIVNEYRGLVPRAWSGRDVVLTKPPVRNLRMSGAISLLLPCVFMACMGIALPFYFLAAQTNVYRSICIEIKRYRACILPSPNYVRWQDGLRLVQARIRIVLVSQNLMKAETKGVTTWRCLVL